MNDNVLFAQTRTSFGKGSARRARRAGLVPAVLYSHGTEPTHIDLPVHELFLVVRSTRNALVTIDIDGERHLALVKDIQRHPVSRDILHADLLGVKASEKVEVEVEIVVVGEPEPGAVHNVENFSVTAEAPANAIPESFEVNIEGLEIGTIIRVADLKAPEGVEIISDPEMDILSITEPQEVELEETTPEATVEEEDAETESE